MTIPSIVVYAQQSTTSPTILLEEGSVQNDELKQQVATTAQQTTLPVDTLTIGGIVATAGGLLLNDRRKSKQMEEKLTAQEIEVNRKEEELKKKTQEIIEIIMDLQITDYKVSNAQYLYPELKYKDVLELKSTNNPLEKNTLGEEKAININKLAKYTVINYHIPMPNMSIPTAQTIQASTVKGEIREVMTKSIATTPEPGGGANTAASSTVKP